MTDQELISKIQELKQIKPRQDWVILAKNRILEQNNVEQIIVKKPTFSQIFTMAFRHKYAFAYIVAFAVLIGAFGVVDNSMPGDSFYGVKKMAEKGQALLISDKGQTKRGLELANERLNDITKIVQRKSTKNLEPAITEYKETVSEVAKNILKDDDIKKIAVEIRKLEDNKQKVEALGVVIGETKELDDAVTQVVSREISDMEGKALTDNQTEVLKRVKESFDAGKYSEALTIILENQ